MIDLPMLGHALFGAFVVGLGTSITLSQTALALLTLLWLWRLRDPGARAAARVGPGGVRREYEGYALPEAIKKRTSHVHSTPLQILVERGALGLAAWLWIWAAFIAKGIGLLRRLPADSARERALVLRSTPTRSVMRYGSFCDEHVDSGLER